MLFSILRFSDKTHSQVLNSQPRMEGSTSPDISPSSPPLSPKASSSPPPKLSTVSPSRCEWARDFNRQNHDFGCFAPDQTFSQKKVEICFSSWEKQLQCCSSQCCHLAKDCCQTWEIRFQNLVSPVYCNARAMARIIVVSRCIVSGVPEDSRVSPSQVSVSPPRPPEDSPPWSLRSPHHALPQLSRPLHPSLLLITVWSIVFLLTHKCSNSFAGFSHFLP